MNTLFVECPATIPHIPGNIASNGDMECYLMVNYTFPCHDKLRGWYYQVGGSTSSTFFAFATVWRPLSSATFELIHKTKLTLNARYGRLKAFAPTSVAVRKGDVIGIHYSGGSGACVMNNKPAWTSGQFAQILKYYLKDSGLPVGKQLTSHGSFLYRRWHISAIMERPGNNGTAHCTFTKLLSNVHCWREINMHSTDNIERKLVCSVILPSKMKVTPSPMYQ